MALTHRSLYRFELVSPTAGLIADLSDICTARSYKIKLNRAETLDLSFNLRVIEERANSIGITPQEMLGTGINEIHVWRGNRPIFGTKVRHITASVQGDSESLDLHASGYLDDFIHRYLWPLVETQDQGGITRYEGWDIGEIMWDMVNTTQQMPAGDMGFTPGIIQTSRLLTDDWQPFATNLKDIFIDITNHSNSVDFDFTYDRELNVYSPGQGRVQDDLLFSYPGNIVSLSAPVDASQIINVSINRGSGNGLDITPIETRHDTTSQGVYGRMEQIDDYADVSYVPTLQSFGDETLRTFALPLVIPDVSLKSGQEPPLGAYWVGDYVPFSIPNRPAFSNIDNRMMRINEIGVSLNDLDTENIRLTVASQ